MKPSSTFKMSKTTKRMLALFPFRSSSEMYHFKRQMISSQLIAEQSQRAVPKAGKDTDPA